MPHRALAVLAFALVLGACHPTPEPEPPLVVVLDAGDIDPDACPYACTRLHDLGCAAGDRPNCVEVCERAEASGMFAVRASCLMAAKDVAGVRACGTRCDTR